jgi:ABC-type uncharacterized transport system fused permease/ATPase subunit
MWRLCDGGGGLCGRLLEHSEAISALRGEATETAILKDLFDQVISWKRKVFKALIPYEASRTLM